MKRTLNERQLAVLEWVGKGCPEGFSAYYKTSCPALQNRGLAKVTRRGGVWNAVLTDAGRHYLAHGTYPEPKSPARAFPAPRLPKITTPPSTPRVPRQPRKTYTVQLLEELDAAGGRVLKSGPDADAWLRRAASASRSGRIPKIKELRWGRHRDGVEIKLVDTPAWRLAVLEPVKVPVRLVRPHAVVRTMLKAKQPLGLTRSVQQRALRIVHALLTASERNGHTCSAGALGKGPGDNRWLPHDPHFMITAQGQTVEFRVVQEMDRSEHIPTDKELADAKKYSWARIPRYDYTPSERLRVDLRGGQAHYGSEWANSSERSVEDQLAEIVHEIGLRGEVSERERLAEVEEARQRCLRWEAAMAEARAQYAEDYRVRQLESQETAWRQATRLSEFLEAARTHAETLPPGLERTRAEEWIEWAMGHVAREHPMARPLRLLDIPEPHADDLKPFLRGWSPYGAHWLGPTPAGSYVSCRIPAC
ncbi:hypothetical protein OG978_33270 [Streptomyces sp. NBC_01591]|uniref:hypothetical protein n=1 Tax=Streptomyces sp. NBC_01591 TaxID=2975888 RepID=UPI002DD9F036|nr:hypothetical protein [Streptomyces sp. NBC_01591]WSD71838.1 hypothetical protein OG978_33270 [Streptomyces sp. NBC_01591]